MPTPLALRLVDRPQFEVLGAIIGPVAVAVVDDLVGGVTTLALGLAANVKAPVWSLEHDPAWVTTIRRRLEILRTRGPTVLHAPLRTYGDIEWYKVPPELPDEFDLVICDGPPGKTPGGRWGLWQVLDDRLRTATVVLDDAQRPGEAEIIDRLRADCWEVEIRPDGRKSFAILTPSSGRRLDHGEPHIARQ